jgi:hypothetical protein
MGTKSKQHGEHMLLAILKCEGLGRVVHIVQGQVALNLKQITNVFSLAELLANARLGCCVISRTLA